MELPGAIISQPVPAQYAAEKLGSALAIKIKHIKGILAFYLFSCNTCIAILHTYGSSLKISVDIRQHEIYHSI